MSNNTFSNSRPILLGEPEDSEGIIVTPALPGLSGSLVLDDSFVTDDALRSNSAVFSGNSLDVTPEDRSPGITISTDGLRLFMVGDLNNTIYQYNLSTANDLSTAVFSGISLDVGSEDTTPRGITISSDGFTLFMAGDNTNRIYQYNLSVANDLSTVIFSGNSIDVNPEDFSPEGITISTDGLRLFMVGSGNDRIFQYNLTTPNDLSTAVFSGISLSVISQDIRSTGLTISSDGLRLFMAGNLTNTIHQYNLSVANDLSTAVFSGNSLFVGSEDTTPEGITISSDGFTLFMAGSQFDTIYQYDLSTVNELGFLDNYSFFSNLTITTEFAQVNAGTLKVGTRVVCVVTGLVGTNFDLQRNGGTIATLVPVVNPISGQPDYFSSFVDTITVEDSYTYGLRVPSNPVTIGSTVLLVFVIQPDDTHAGVIDSIAIAGKQINAADSHRTHESSVLPSSEEVFSNSRPILLGDAEDSVGVIDTPAVAGLTGSLTLDDSFLTDDALRSGSDFFSGNSIDVNPEDTIPEGITISTDGLRLFMVGDSNNRIFQYNLSVANDLSTAVFSGISLSISSEDPVPKGLTISTDGFRLFMSGNGNDRIFQYNLTIPNDLSTAVFSGISLSISSEDTVTRGLTISSDGFTLFMSGDLNNSIYQYDLSTANDISTAVFSGNSLDVSTEDIGPRGITISTDGLRLFMAGNNNVSIFQYNLSVANDITTAIFSGNSLDVSPEDLSTGGITISTDGLTLLHAGNSTNTIYQYDLLFPGEIGGDDLTDSYSFSSDIDITTEFVSVDAGTLKVGTKVVIVVSGLVGIDLNLQRNGSTISTLIPVLNPISGQPDYFSSLVDTITVETSYTYGLRVPTNPVTIGSTVLLVFVIQPDDTHVGFIQSIAIAGKQINVEDSHRTHEQAVLPD